MSSDQTPRLGLPDMPETPELYPDIVADAFARLDAYTDLYLKGQFVNTPPASPSDGDAYLIGGSPTGAWSGYAYKIAACRDGAWTMLTPFNGLRAFLAGTGAFLVYADGVWTDWTALIGAGETSIASAATCDIGAVGSLFVAITGTTSITSLGTSANRLRFVRFAGALTLTHHATSLVLPGGANLVTAAGDTAIFASDGSGNWRCRQYGRAASTPFSSVSPVFTGLAVFQGDLQLAGRCLVGTTALLGSSNTLPGINLDPGWSWFASDDAMYLQRPGGADGAFQRFYKGSTNVGHVSVSGATTVYATSSDARLKIVSPQQGNYRNTIRALWVGDFHWTQNGAPGFGVLAQQAWEVMPNHQGVTAPATRDGTWHASAEPFAHLALWGVKDIYGLVEALAARIAALEVAHAG